MPDGTPLASVLASWDARDEARGGASVARGDAQKRRRGTKAERSWAAAAPPTPQQTREGDESLRLLSGRRRRRYLNELQLRELAGELDAEDVGALFTPVPFGVERTTLFAQLRACSLVDDFLAHADAAHGHADPATRAATCATAVAWLRVGRRGRVALRRGVAGAPLTVLAQEAALQAFNASSASSVVLEGDSFSRLLTHALVAWRGPPLTSSSTTDADTGARGVLVRKSGAAAGASPAVSCSSFLLKLQA